MTLRSLRLPWSIRNRILVPYLGLILMMVSLTGLACGYWAAARARQGCIERGRSIAEILGRSRFPLTDAVLDQLKGLGGAEFVLLDPADRVRTSTLGNGLSGSTLALPLSRADRQTGWADLNFDRTWKRNGVEYRVAVLSRPRAAEPRDFQRLLILLPEPTLRAAAWEAERAALALSLVGAVLAVLLAAALGRNLSRPLSAILQVIRQIGRGDLNPKDLPRRADEIGELADGVGQMARWLRQLQDERVQTERLRLIRQVSAGMAHELRNPLTAARMTVQLFIERNRSLDAEPLRIALAELTRMERQVRRFLQIARPEPPCFEETDLGPILERTASGLEALLAHRGVRLTTEEDVDGLRVRVDPEQIGQVLVNLLGNAIDAAGPGGRVRLISRATRPDLAAVDVEDNGPGVPAAEEARLFQPFFTTKPEGVGLGLALCAALVGEHGGRLEYSRVAGWTRFRISLPRLAGDGDGSYHDLGRRTEHLLGIPELSPG